MKHLLAVLVTLTVVGCNKNNEPGTNLKLAGTTWVAEYSTHPTTGEVLYDRYRFTTDKDAVNESYYQVSKIIYSTDLTYKYNPPELLLTHDSYTYWNEVVGNKIKRGQIEYIRQ